MSSISVGICVILAILAFILEDSYAQRSRSYNVPYQTTEHSGGFVPSSASCDDRSCYPATGNLLIGREDKLRATSTCGQRSREKFCIVSHLEERRKCFWCYGNDTSTNHDIQNIVSKPGPGRKKKWWQSENGVEMVSLSLDLEAEFHFTHLIITFKTFRPAAMLIERSFDEGRTWRVYRYFAYDCAESFPGVPTGTPRNITDVICENRYSQVAPSTEGEVIFRVLPPNIHIDNPYAEEVQNLLKLTNLRINFTRLHTLGDDFLDNRKEIKEKYYYSIYDMVIRGSCSCYGHASRCEPLEGVQVRDRDMVHGKCQCTHHTKGHNCEDCDDFYNDLPWAPAVGKMTNACKKCNCNEHATRCHFDAAVYEVSGKVSGGVCDDCQHNTMGKNCERCKLFFYRDPSKGITHPETCVPCDCDPRGSLDDGICDSNTEEESGFLAGRCHCKSNVQGRRCDRCKNGFWNFQVANYDGCEPCSCDTLGTVGNQGCNQYTGECTCKRYVTGRDCNQCLPEHYGLSEDPNGCKPCDCDPGGSFDNECDIHNGQCKCRNHVTGRRCDQPNQGYFAGLMDYFVYEAELAEASDNTRPVRREPHSDRNTTWTGDGFLQVHEGSVVEFPIDNIVTSMEYDVVIRYDSSRPGRWENVRVTIDRPGHVDRNDRCANTIPADDRKQVQLFADRRSEVVHPPACFEAGKRYKIKLEFRRYDTHVDAPTASILLDSIVLIPRINDVPFFQGGHLEDRRRQEFEGHRCSQQFQNVVKQPIPEVCRKHLYSIGFYVYGGGKACDCDVTGSSSAICDSLGGQCRCKTNVVGRRCDKCALGTFEFGPLGCQPCDCSSVGSLDNFCDMQTGQCECRSKAYGRRCDECQPGFWNYPTCQPCDCNNHADTCDPRTGFCIDCRDYTAGARCDQCEEGFYGDPRFGVDIPCRPCPCPGPASSGHSYAKTCILDPRTQNVVCHCSEGYAGDRCDRCADNFYGNPDVTGGKCQPCNCNRNIDVTRPGNCDGRTGECQQCLFNTEGFTCNRCKPGFFGDAVNQLCQACACNELGTDPNLGPCDNDNGQCRCYSNVTGRACDQCMPYHWKLASGAGCVACDCDPFGSISKTCNEYDGQCQCREGFGGIRCDECQQFHWGDPNVQCYPCHCNREGSETLQCERETGVCRCLKGVGGEKCDTCARGYTGRFPYCEPCGECFDNWDLIIQGLKEDTLGLIERAKNIKQSGATGAYTEQFAEMDRKLDEVREILASANITNTDIDALRRTIDELRRKLTDAEDELGGIEIELDQTNQRIGDASLNLNELRRRIGEIQMDAQALKENATALQEANVEGALNITREAQRKSRGAQSRVDATGVILEESARQRRRTEHLIDSAQEAYDHNIARNKESLDKMTDDISRLERQIPDLNDMVCDARGDPCDNRCGGAGCGLCGGISCDKGAVTKADNALSLAKEADQALKDKEKKADELLTGIREAKRESDKAHEEALKAFNAAQRAKNVSEAARGDVEDLLERIDEFLEPDNTKPSDIRDTAQKVLAKAISLKPDQIMQLARQITDTVGNLTNIDAILADTRDDVAKAEALKRRADRAKEDADGVLDTTKRVNEALDAAKTAQEAAQAAITKANEDISKAEVDLTQTASETDAAQGVANKSADAVEALKGKLNGLKQRFVENELDMKKAMQEANVANNLANQAERQADELEHSYRNAASKLDDKANASGTAKERAEALRERANKLAQDSLGKLGELKTMEDEFNLQEIRLRDLTEELERLRIQMEDHLTKIEERTAHYRDCQL